MSAYWMWWIAAPLLIARRAADRDVLPAGDRHRRWRCGGVAAWLGAAMPVQWLIAGVLGVVGTIAAAALENAARRQPPPQQSLDIGQTVQVQSWGPDGTARVAYRGTHLGRRARGAATPRARDRCTSSAMRGSVLILSRSAAPIAASA